MTDREKAIVMAYTGVTMLSGEKFQIFHEYIEDILGRPVWTHELADKLVWNEIKEKSKNDFIEICKTEDKTVERPKGVWIVKQERAGAFVGDRAVYSYTCPFCKVKEFAKYPFCHFGADMREAENDRS